VISVRPYIDRCLG